MGNQDIGKAQASNMTTQVADWKVIPMNTDGADSQDETIWQSTKWSIYWGYFNAMPELKQAIMMKAIWNVGKGWASEDKLAEVILNKITGWGKDTFDDILFNMEVTRAIGGDAYAEIIRNDRGTLINLKPLDPSSMRHVINKQGILVRFEQVMTSGKIRKLSLNDIFYLATDRFADQIHGISKIAVLEETIKAEMENFTDIKKLMHHQVRPFIIWKLKTDNATEIDTFVNKIDKARSLGEDMFIPDDDDTVSHEIVQVNPSAVIMAWRDNITNKFYRSLGLPLIIFGQAGATESGGKIEYLAHEQVFAREQRFIEKQVWNQLALKIKLVPPISLMENLERDQAKDAGQGIQMDKAELGVSG